MVARSLAVMSSPTWVHAARFSRTAARGRRGAGAVVAIGSADRHARTVRRTSIPEPETARRASPSMSSRSGSTSPLSAYTRTWPASGRYRRSSKRQSPRGFRPRTLTQRPRIGRLSFAFDGVAPSWSNSHHSLSTRRTRPMLFPYEPIATRVPSVDIDTETPDPSPAASPSILEPICVHVYVWSNRRGTGFHILAQVPQQLQHRKKNQPDFHFVVSCDIAPRRATEQIDAGSQPPGRVRRQDSRRLFETVPFLRTPIFS